MTEETAAVITQNKRKRLFIILAGVLASLGVLYLLWYIFVGSQRVTSDNGYVGADIAQISPMASGAVQDVLVSDTQMVKKDDILVKIDDADAKIALAQAEAGLAQAQRDFQRLGDANTGLAAQANARATQISAAQAQLATAQAAYAKAKLDYDRRKAIEATGAVSAQELADVQNALNAASAALANAKSLYAQAQAGSTAAKSELAANQALLSGFNGATNPGVKAAQARLDAARLNMERTLIRAPIDGMVAKRNVQIGQSIAPGFPLMTIVPTRAVYVDANLKESQLRNVKAGQKVTLISDKYGSSFTFHGKVLGIGGGTGSAFSLIPAQNATGNWIKVVQRVPVRIALDPKEVAEHPLSIGMSMDVDIDISN